MIAVANLSLSILFAREADVSGLGIYALIGAACWAVLPTAPGCLALVAAQRAIIAIVAFSAYLWIKHEQADVTLGSGSAP